jgi:hypothetical protein
MTIQSYHKGPRQAHNFWAHLGLFVVVAVIAYVLAWQYVW